MRETDLAAPRPKRHKIDVACEMCRARKVRCDGVRPTCGNCHKRLDMRDRCTYSAAPIERTFDSNNNTATPGSTAASLTQQTGGDGHGPAVSNPPMRGTPTNNRSPTVGRRMAHPVQLPGAAFASPSPASGHVPSVAGESQIDSMTTVVEEGTSTAQYFGSSSAGSFTKQIKAAIDARLGKSPPAAPSSSHNNGASFVGTASPGHRDAGSWNIADDPNYVLPGRRQADHLMDLYWHYVDTLYPFLDRDKWSRNYANMFAGTPLGTDERIFVSTLNIIFALSTQLIESLRPEQRDESSRVYFQRAQALLRLSLWEPGSLELVQCLLLMSQYLQTTSSAHQTWMVVGTAVRTAQSLGLHLPETSAGIADPAERELVRRLWHGCVLMDRMVSMTHGRPPIVLHQHASAVPLPLSSQSEREGIDDEQIRVSFFVQSVQLYEIIHLSIIAFYLTGEAEPSSQGAREKDLETLLRLDSALETWEQNLPSHLCFATVEDLKNDICKRQAVILRLRFLQARLLLLRPTMARFCLDQPPSKESKSTGSLASRVVQQVASLCVATAQEVVTVLARFEAHDGTVGLLPAWWYRLYFVYSAATILIVARLRPELAGDNGLHRSWEEAVSVLRAHERFGQSARRCVAVLNILSGRIMQNQQAAARPSDEGPAPGENTQAAHPAFFDPADSLQQFGDLGAFFPDLELPGLAFGASDLSDLNMHAWELLTGNQPWAMETN
ncbi:fungal-specific transcription factor domain-containing protein [Achaetomium macrosporum]|uniref:Fungal-specific transcription factor domain-containing protein n=1 Tax=Achaetomium macrosporum TaxID=79813 RepID=A0AAN7H965_9PEZI|nr:fungal-specific transcription factor domain-containing protein [Achaetomium macrosporum]